MGAAVTLNEIELMSYRRLGYEDTPATEVVTRMRQWINTWHQRLLARPGIQLLRDSQVNFTTTIGQAVYTLAANIRRVDKVFLPDVPTVLRMESLQWLREHDPGLQAKGIPELWIPATWNLVTPPLAQLRIQLWPIPADVYLVYVDCAVTAADLVSASDEPLLPFEYHWLLVEAACYEEWLRKADTRAGTSRQDLETGFKEMRHWLLNPQDYKPRAGNNPAYPSRLGGMYPSW
jgi:hypothetical protein